MNRVKQISIRVYGLIFYRGKLLVTDEFRLGRLMTKFPGGGLEPGEGTLGCLHRECLEELGQAITITGHLYTTDFYQESEFLSDVIQILNVYYTARPDGPPAFRTTEKVFDFEPKDGAQAFRWMTPAMFNPDHFTLPVDRHLVGMILKGEVLLPDSEGFIIH